MIEKLLELKWWNWSEEKILNEVSILNSENIKEFVNKFC